MRHLSLALVSLMALGWSGAALAGEWGTNCGTLSLPDDPVGASIHAPYSMDNGRIIGRMNKPKCPDCGVTIDGVWVEDGSAKTCESSKDGSAHWGGVHLEFNADYTSFKGSWNYCGQGAGSPWTGKLGVSKGGGVNK